MVGKKVKVLMSAFLAAALLGGCASSKTGNSSEKVFKIGITQIVEHSALDSARKGFIQALKENGYEDGKNLKIDFQNAQGDMPTTQTIAQQFVNDKVDMIFAISTPSAQAAYNATKEIPIVITAVTDPVSAGLAKSMDSSGNNVTGTSDATPMEQQFELFMKLYKNTKKVGMIYNTSESNSGIQVEQAKALAAKMGLTIVPQGITSVNDIPQTIDSLLGKIDLLYLPTDNMVASSMPIIVKKCYAASIPVIGSEKGEVEGGALCTVGIDYNKLGYESGLKAVEILKGKAPKDIKISVQENASIIINSDAAKKLNITIPEEIKKGAAIITGGVK
ncbi:MAG: ABC transporter substrate-binding protein [Bacillota bacterium]|nr:ABC transporter substrate-binding protein [Bacillota bacterium]